MAQTRQHHYKAFLHAQTALLEPFCLHFIGIFPQIFDAQMPAIALLQHAKHLLLQTCPVALTTVPAYRNSRQVKLVGLHLVGRGGNNGLFISGVRERFDLLPFIARAYGFGMLSSVHDQHIAHYLLCNVCFPTVPTNTSGILLQEPFGLKRFIPFAVPLFHVPQWKHVASTGWQCTCWVLSCMQFKEFPLSESGSTWYYVQARVQFNHECKWIDCKMQLCIACPQREAWKRLQ